MSALAGIEPALLAALLAAGIVTGLLSGLLGIGGGVVAVPVLLEVFAAAGLDPVVQPLLAIGTAHALVLVASIAAMTAHVRAGRVDMSLVRAWTPALLVGATAGLVLGRLVVPEVLLGLFAMVATVLGAVMLSGEGVRIARALPGGATAHGPPGLVGLLAAALGIGGGTLSGPVLALFSVPLSVAIGAGSVFNLLIAAPATLVFVFAGLEVAGRPAASLGHVALVPLLLLAVPAILVAPPAARLSALLPVPVLRRLFGLVLFAIAARLIARAMGG